MEKKAKVQNVEKMKKTFQKCNKTEKHSDQGKKMHKKIGKHTHVNRYKCQNR